MNTYPFLPFSLCIQDENQIAHLYQQPHGFHVLSEHYQGIQSANSWPAQYTVITYKSDITNK